VIGDYYDMQFRIGYHPGVKVYVPPPPPPTPAPPAAIPAPVHTLTVKAACDPCTVEVGKTSTVSSVQSEDDQGFSLQPGQLGQSSGSQSGAQTGVS